MPDRADPRAPAVPPAGGTAGPDTPLAALVSAAAAGDEGAWGELVRRYSPLVLSVVGAYRLDRADAADVNQTVWLRLVEHLGRIREPAALAAWLVTTARRECYRMVRVGRRTQPFDPLDDAAVEEARVLPAAEAVPPEEGVIRAERRQALREAFAQLPPRCRKLLSLLVADPPVSYREISATLEMPIGSIGPSQARCLRKLRDCPALAPFVVADPEAEGSGGDRDGAVAAGR
ncbi:sigma-70 family RNA polymerase sigma factor [Micromonospora sp. NPDC049559]|uniref:RNA polymerase sigma factor n=1 Tax=Micromonospora sp. NPDC049559 TaxID=3155923 RepID=UPI00341C7A14